MTSSLTHSLDVTEYPIVFVCDCEADSFVLASWELGTLCIPGSTRNIVDRSTIDALSDKEIVFVINHSTALDVYYEHAVKPLYWKATTVKLLRLGELPGMRFPTNLAEWTKNLGKSGSIISFIDAVEKMRPEQFAPVRMALPGVTNNYDGVENWSDLGNAERLDRYFGHIIRYVAEFKKWFLWDATRWVSDVPSAIDRLAQITVRKMAEEANNLNETEREAFRKFAIKSENAFSLAALVKLAKALPGVSIQQHILDSDHDLLNAVNGTINLRTGTLKPHNQYDYITKRITVEYDPSAKCPTWEVFLHKIMDGNDELIRYIQKAIGYSLSGHTHEQCIFIPHGEGSNGKSVLIKTIEYILADYATHCPADALMISNKGKGGVNNEIARLRGSRFVAAVETDENVRLSESLIKQLTGGDTVTARFLYGEYFDFSPTFKIWLACNHRPKIFGTDHGIWRRIKLIPFNVIIPDEEQDKALTEKLQAEAKGILAWAVRGCMLWRKEGLGEPQDVTDATSEYRREMDLIGAWIDSNCVLDKHIFCGAEVLYTDFAEWARLNGEYCISNRMFGMKMVERGFQRTDKSQGRFYIGINCDEKQIESKEERIGVICAKLHCKKSKNGSYEKASKG